ncbi:MAG: glycosyltransferase family 39 protein [Ignavibacteriales bacterium]|nr:glycosyltransferase family 39 protein [Ignavibacteriales bacterium]
MIFFILGLLRLNDLTIYTPDSSRYLIFANSLSHGNGFVDETQPEPDRFVVQAPLYPVLLAPVQWFYPMSLEVSKIWTLLWGVLAILLFYRWILKLGSPQVALFAAMLFAFNPLTIVYSSEVLSEAPFLVFTFLALIYFDKEYSKSKNWYLFIIFIIAITFLREIGVVFALASVIFLFLSKKYKNAFSILFIISLSLSLWYARNHYFIGADPQWKSSNYSLLFQHIVTPPDSSIINEFALRVWLNIQSSFLQLGGMLIYPLFQAQQFKLQLLSSEFYNLMQIFFNSAGKYLIVLITLPLIIRGVYLDFRKSINSIFRLSILFFYLIAIFIYPVLDIRFLFPILPFLLFYISITLIDLHKEHLITKFFNHSILKFGLVLILLLPNAAGVYEILKLNLAYSSSPIQFYEKYGEKEKCPVMFTQPWELLGAWIRNNLPDSVVIASPVKNISTVIGNRKMLEVDQGVVQPVFESLLRDNDVKYILSPSRGKDLKIFHFLMLESKRFWFEKIYRIGNLYLYKIHSIYTDKIDPAKVLCYEPDSLSMTFLFENGRRLMLNGNYRAARSVFAQALQIDSVHPSILYQMIVCRTLALDSSEAMKYYSTLYKLPQALGFVFQARLHIQAMEKVLKAEQEKYTPSRGVEYFHASSIYWKLGYPIRAAQIMNDYLKIDSSYFNGLLWGLHYNVQTGDTIQAKKYLDILNNIDSKNQVVQSFTRIFSIFDSIKVKSDSLDKSSFHFLIAEEYKKIELFEESLDESAKAIGLNHGNIDAYLLSSENFEKKNNVRMSRNILYKTISLQPENMRVRSRLDSLQKVYQQ